MNEKFSDDKRSRLPPGQHITERFPVLQKGTIPHIDREKYTLEIEGEVENPRSFSYEELKNLKDREIIVDIHCVTSWSKFDSRWGGISFKKLFNIVKPTMKAHYVEFYCADEGFTTTVPIKKVLVDNSILALLYDGLPITENHGGPVRPIIPDLYFYKSAKWIIKINFLETDRLGYWERGGYSNKADPWKEQRYSYQD